MKSAELDIKTNKVSIDLDEYMHLVSINSLMDALINNEKENSDNLISMAITIDAILSVAKAEKEKFNNVSV